MYLATIKLKRDLEKAFRESLLQTLRILSLKLNRKITDKYAKVYICKRDHLASDVYLHMPLFAHSIHHTAFNWSPTSPTDGDAHFVMAG